MLIFASRIDGISPTALLPEADTKGFLDISIELKNRRPDTKLQLKVTADTGTQKYGIKEGNQSTIRPALHHRM